MNTEQAYCCAEPQCNRVLLIQAEKGLSCPNGHFFPFVPGTQVPVFAREPEGSNEYAGQDAATRHENSLRWVFNSFDTDEASLRQSLIARLEVSKGARVLVTGAGAGNDLPYLAESLGGQGEIYAQDIAEQMLVAGAKRHQNELTNSGVRLHFSLSDAMNLPFLDDYFDAAYHFGGINLFFDIRKGIDEMNRVVKPGGKVVISDEGIAPWLKDSDYGRMLIRNNPLYDCSIPLSLLPKYARSVRLTWEMGNCFYVIEFSVSNKALRINIDVPHIGKRGGSIRTRYFGQLEGVDPALRDRIYDEAERQGNSRVEYIESLLRAGLSGN